MTYLIFISSLLLFNIESSAGELKVKCRSVITTRIFDGKPDKEAKLIGTINNLEFRENEKLYSLELVKDGRVLWRLFDKEKKYRLEASNLLFSLKSDIDPGYKKEPKFLY